AKTTPWNEFSSTMASAIICLATNQKFNFSKYIFNNMVKNLEGGVKFLMYLRFVQVFLDKQVEGMSKHKEIYVTPSHTKKVFANMKRQGTDFSGRDTPLFPTMMVQAPEEVGEGSDNPTNPHPTPTTTQPSTSKPKKKQSRRKQRKGTEDAYETIAEEAVNVESVPTHSNDPLLNGEDRLQLNELMDLCTKLQQRVLDLENAKISQDSKIAELKRKVKKLEKKKRSRTPVLKRLRKGGRSARIESSEDEGLGDQEDASKQGRKVADIDADAEVTLIDETQERNDDNLMFDTGVLDEQEVEVEKVVSTAEVTTASATTTTVDELTLAHTLIEIKAAKPKAITTAATITTTVVTRPKVRGVMIQEPSEFTTTISPSQPSQLPQAKDKGKAKMVKPEKPLKKKDQILQTEEEANIALIESWNNVQAMIEADRLLAERLQAREQEELTDEEKARFSKRAGTELEQEVAKKQKIDDDQEEAEMKKHMEIVLDEEEIAVDAIPLATKPPIIVDWKIIKEGKIRYFQIIRADKLVKAKHGLTRPEEVYERVLWGDLKVMFEPDVEKKRYPLTPATITEMLNKKLQIDQWNEMSYQLLKLITKQLKNPGSGRIVRIKRLHDDLGVNTAKLVLLVQKLMLLVITAERLQLLEELLLLEG
ncbi:hypothetical protein Tco_0500369, partial [Tanacetum coccineum]